MKINNIEVSPELRELRIDKRICETALENFWQDSARIYDERRTKLMRKATRSEE